MTTQTAHSSDAIALKQRMRSELRWLRLRLITHATLMALGGAGLITAIAVLASPAWMPRGPWAAWAVWVGIVFVIAWVSTFEVVLALRRIANLKGFSRTLEEHGSYGNLLEAATQFTSPKKEDPLRWGASATLVEEILRRARHEAERTTLAPRVPLVGAPLHVGLGVFALLLWLGIGLWGTERANLAFAALANPSSLAHIAPESGIYSTSGDVRVAIGGDVVLRGRDFSEGDESVVLLVNRTGEFWQESDTVEASEAEQDGSYQPFMAQLNGVEDPFRYRFRKGSVQSPIHQVTVRERPVVRSLHARIVPPAYSGRPTLEREELGGTVSVLAGSEVELDGRATAGLDAAWRVADGEEPVALSVEGDRFVDQFTVLEDMNFRITLEDVEGLESAGHTVYRFIARPDLAPTVEISRPGEDRTLERDLRIAIAGLAADDVGLQSVELLHRTESETEWRRIPLYRHDRLAEERADLQERIVEVGENEVAIAFVWNLGEESLFPGDTMLYCFEATDNNALEGGQRTRSQVYRLRLPTMAEVFDQEKEGREQDRGDLAELREEGEELQETLERLNRELKKNPNPDWAKQQEIKDALERQQALREQLQETAEELQQDLQNFEENNSGSMELLEKMETVQELLENIQDESLQSYLEAMQEAMDQLLPHEVQRAMEDALGNQEEYNRRLDRTIELLRQLERERTMSDLVEELSEHLERQEELLAQTDPEQQQGEGEVGEQESENSGDESDEGESSDESGESSDEDMQSGEESQQDSEGSQEGSEDSKSGESNDSEQSESGENEAGENEESLSEEELARAQEKLAEQVKELEERIAQALEELKQQQEQGEASDPSAGEMSESLQDAQDQMQQEGNPSESMSDAGESLQEQQRQEASEQQQEAIRRLLYLYETLAEGQQSMQQASQQYAVEKLQQTAFDLLHLSFSEEKVIDSLDDAARGQRLAPVTREQGRIQRSAATLSHDLQELAQKNFMIPEPLLDRFRDLVAMLEQSVEELQLQRSRRARSSSLQSMGQMNQIVMNLLTTAMNSSQGGGGGSSSQSLSQQMQQMGQDQSRLNAMTEQLRRSMQDGLSEEERRQLADLRGRQQALQQQLEEIRGDIDDERRILGDLDELAEEMEEVVEGFESGRLDADMRRQQEKILSRLLDAQRSIRERDFAKRRESREGDRLYVEQEGMDLFAGDPEDAFRLRRWLAPEKAPHAYQEDVRRYFRRIEDALEPEGR